MVFELDLRIFALQCLCHDFSPQPRARQDVRLVYRVDRKRRVGRDCDLRPHARYALHLFHTVDHGVPRYVLLRRNVLLFALAKVDTADELAHNNDVDAFGDGFFQGRVDDEGV